MTDPKPLTSEELDELAREGAKGRITGIGPVTLDRLIAQCRRCLELEAAAKEREELERRRDEFLVPLGNDLQHTIASSGGKHQVCLWVELREEWLRGTLSDSYWAALSDALGKLGTEGE